MIDISTTKHIEAFPAKVAAGAGSPHQFNIVLLANADNGTLCTLGDYVSFDTFKAGAIPNNFTFAGKILEKSTNGNWWIQVTEPADAIFLYNTPKSPYPEEELRDPKLFFNGRDEGSVRGYTLSKNDIIEISDEGFTGNPAANKAVSYASGKYVVAS